MEAFFIILSPLLCALIAAFYAQERGRDPVAWYFIALFAGAIGLLTLFILKPYTPSVQKR